MSKSAQGRKHSEQTKKLISLASRGINNPNFGKIHSEKTKALISLAPSVVNLLFQNPLKL